MSARSKPKPATENSYIIRCGQFTIIECGNGKLWLQKRGGEGMETSEAMFEKLIAKFFKKEF